MARRRHPGIPNTAKLASGVVVAGVCLGMLVATAVNPVMKDPVEPWWSLSGRGDPNASQPDPGWIDTAPQAPQVTDGFRPDFDYDEVIGAEWALPEEEIELEPETLPPLDEAFEAAQDAAEAAAATQAVASAQPPLEAEPGSATLTPPLAQDGLY